MPCHPSAACRRSRPDRCASVTIGSVAPSRCCTGDKRTACGWRLGIQNRDCRSGGVSGSHGKSQTPTLRKFVKLLASRLLHLRYCLEVAMIVLMATKILPGETGRGNSFRVPVSRRRTPINAKHGAPPYSRARRATPGQRVSETGDTEYSWNYTECCSCRPHVYSYFLLNNIFVNLLDVKLYVSLCPPERAKRPNSYLLEKTCTSSRAVSIVKNSPPISASRAIASQSI